MIDIIFIEKKSSHTASILIKKKSISLLQNQLTNKGLEFRLQLCWFFSLASSSSGLESLDPKDVINKDFQWGRKREGESFNIWRALWRDGRINLGESTGK